MVAAELPLLQRPAQAVLAVDQLQRPHQARLGLRATRLQPVLEGLLAGEAVEHILDENVVFDELARSDRTLWSLLVFSGYLKAEMHAITATGQIVYRLTIPNREVRIVYADTFRLWMEDRMAGHGGNLDEFTRALLAGDAASFQRELQAFAMDLLSYHDAGTARPENLYQGFVIGLLAVMEPTHLVRSNRESGAGRPDVLIRPRVPGKPGVVLELKVARPGEKTLDAALGEALTQLADNDYGAELRAAGATRGPRDGGEAALGLALVALDLAELAPAEVVHDEVGRPVRQWLGVIDAACHGSFRSCSAHAMAHRDGIHSDDDLVVEREHQVGAGADLVVLGANALIGGLLDEALVRSRA
jgi:PD-(D/E)XK nuclease superfamily